MLRRALKFGQTVVWDFLWPIVFFAEKEYLDVVSSSWAVSLNVCGVTSSSCSFDVQDGLLLQLNRGKFRTGLISTEVLSYK